MRHIFFTLIFSSFSFFAFSQNEGNNWYFGDYGGITFNSGAPVAVYDGQMSTLEGCASISDSDGNLLFYTDGTTVWNANHNVMANGHGLLGTSSSTQSGVIVPKPGSANIYYVFTVDDCYNSLTNGIRYSTVDMNQNGGLGRVTSKNTLLVLPVAEKISAVVHYNGTDYWVLTHGYNNNRFYAYLITARGVSSTPVISEVGQVHYGTNDPGDQCGDYGNSRGYMKASPDGGKIAVAIGRSEIFELFDFDNSTGQVSNPITFDGYHNPYGIEFSPNGTKLYVSSNLGTWPSYTGRLFQVDLLNNNQITQIATETDGNGYGAMQVGPDQKVYVGKVYSTFLDVVNNPDMAGAAANFQANAVNVGREVYFGLPTFIQSYFYNPEFSYENICFEDTTDFTITETDEIDSVLWNFDDPASGENNISRQLAPSHQFSAPGNYNVQLIAYYPSTADTVFEIVSIMQPSVELGENLEFCGSGQLNAGGGMSSYLWSDGSTSQTNTVAASGTYWVQVTDLNQCTNSDTTTVTVHDEPQFVSDSTNLGCPGENNAWYSINITDGAPPYQYSIYSGSFQGSNRFNNLAPASYLVTVRDQNDCTYQRDVEIEALPEFNFAYQTDSVKCYGQSNGSIALNLSGGTPGYSYQWSNGETTPTISNLPADTFFVEITDFNNCTARDTTIVNQPDTLQMSIVPKDIECNGETNGAIDVEITGGTPAYSYTWSNNGTQQDLSDLPVGDYKVTVSDANNCTISDSVTITQPTFIFSISNAKIHDALCYSENSGYIDLTISGGTHPLQFEWSNWKFTEDIDSLVADTYFLQLTDNNGCLIDTAFTVGEPDAPLSLTFLKNNVTCHGGDDGNIDIQVAGGTQPYAYQWQNSTQTQDLQGLSAGEFSVEIIDNNRCTLLDTFEIAEPPEEIQILFDTTAVKCYGQATGSISPEVSGGIPGYSYQWANGTAQKNLENIPAGKYVLTVTDHNGCRKKDSISISQPRYPLLLTNSMVSDVKCKGEINGAVYIAVGGGTSPYSYLWSNNDTIQDIDSLRTGSYTVQITDNNGCTLDSAFTVSEPEQPLASEIFPQNTACHSAPNGEIRLNPTGGTPPYRYQWSNGQQTRDIQNLTPGKYSVRIWDNNFCTTTDSAIVNQPDSIILQAQIEPVSCLAGSDGSITLNISGGIYPYSVQWTGENSFSATTQNLDNLLPGNYTATVSDANGCTASTTVEITQPAYRLEIYGMHLSHVRCRNGQDGAIDLNVGGGTQPYTFNWSTNDTIQDLDSLFAGSYSVEIIDNNGCRIDSAVQITQPATGIELSSSVSDLNCFGGGSDGFIDLSVSGGTPGYDYLWSNGAVTEDIAGLQAGSYTVTVSDQNNCTATENIVVADALRTNFDVQHVSCHGYNDGSIDLSINGGTPGYTFAWSTGATSEDLSQLTPGNYSVTVTDRNGCQAVRSATIEQPTYRLGIQNAIVQNIVCRQAATGEIELQVSGGTQPYHYQWSNNDTTARISALPAGEYSVLIIDQNGCSTDSAFTISQPATRLQLQIAENHVNCFGQQSGSVDLEVSGGVPQYSYQWSNGENTEDITSLFAGKYQISVTDAIGCTVTDSALISQPAQPLSVSLEKSNIKCHGQATGYIETTVFGGTPEYSYEWSDGSTQANASALLPGEYFVVVSDQNGCRRTERAVIDQPLPFELDFQVQDVKCFGEANGSISLNVSGQTPPYSLMWETSDTTESISELPFGYYSVAIRDSNECFIRDSAYVAQPEMPLAAEALPKPVSCFGGNNGEISLEVSGGTPGYDFLWSDGSQTQNLNFLLPGNYSVTITDHNGCEAFAQAEVTEPDDSLQLSYTTEPASCFGGADGSIDLSVTGGVQPYSYLWSNDSTTQDLFRLPTGEYFVAVSDFNGCQRNLLVQVQQPAFPIQISVIKTDLLCYGDPPYGEIDITVGGGTPGYEYLWSNGATNEDIESLSPGDYSVQVSDAKGCTLDSTISIVQPENPIELQAEVTPVTCFGGSDGAVDLSIVGGTPAYLVEWETTGGDNKGSMEDLEFVSAAHYIASVVDAQGCTAADTFEVPEPGELSISYEKGDVNCHGGSDGSISLNVSGGVPGYLYEWSNGAAESQIQGLLPGLYSVEVTDQNECSTSQDILIDQPLALSLSFETNYSCYGANDGEIDLTVGGGTPPFTYLWSNNAQTQDLNNLPPGEYSLSLTDANNCQISGAVEIVEPDELKLNYDVSPASCNDKYNGSIVLLPRGGSPPYTYFWDNLNNQLPEQTELPAGFYSVSLTDSKGCAAQAEIQVPIEFEDCIKTATAFTPNSDGFNDFWQIRGIEVFPKAEVELFDRYGNLLARLRSSDFPYDGKYNGKTLPFGTYYFVINLNENNIPPLTGTVTIIK